MKNIFKVAVIATAMTMTAITVNAQTKGDMAGGVKLAYLTDSGYDPFGIGVKFQYNALDNLRLEPSFTFFMPEKIIGINTNAMVFSANAHWLFRAGKKVNIYPLAGLGVVIAHASYEGNSASNTQAAFNFGCGADFFVSQKGFINVEGKFMIADGTSFIPSVGYGFMF